MWILGSGGVEQKEVARVHALLLGYLFLADLFCSCQFFPVFFGFFFLRISFESRYELC